MLKIGKLARGQQDYYLNSVQKSGYQTDWEAKKVWFEEDHGILLWTEGGVRRAHWFGRLKSSAIRGSIPRRSRNSLETLFLTS